MLARDREEDSEDGAEGSEEGTEVVAASPP